MNFKFKRRAGAVWLVVLIVVLALGVTGGGGYFGYKFYKSRQASRNNQSSSASKVTDAATTPTSKVARVVDEGVTWITPVKLDDLKLFSAVGENSMVDSTDYYKVGTTAAGSDIVVAQVRFQMGGLAVHRFIKKDGQYLFLGKNSDAIDRENYGYETSANVGQSDTVFKSLLADKIISKGQTDLIQQSDTGIAESETQAAGTAKLIQETKWGNLSWFQNEGVSDIKNFQSGYYFVQLNDGTKMVYEAKPQFMTEDGVFQVSWKSASATAAFGKLPAGGCGLGVGAMPTFGDKASLTSGKVIATTAAGSKLYAPSDANDSLAQLGYDSYKIGRDEGQLIAIDEFVAKIGVVAWIDDFGTPIIYQQEEYRPMAECGKPVVYLYPTEDTQVTVKVGANVTKSEPTYDKSWQVLARPSGQLLVGGQSYSSLFWEGLGWGEYPVITQGRVVATSQVEEAITSDLTHIGLNQREIGDFLEFWLPKMPNTPYTRLTWLQNKEMDKLAPLAVSPKPDSSIRVFLDFNGLDSPQTISSQTLVKMPRAGFTLVEWGGLLK
jgi:hypothetical protein